MKKLYFGSNLKMYKGIRDTNEYLKKLADNTRDFSRDEMELFIIPSYTSLPDAVRQTDSKLIRLGAQNMGWEDEGQFTGEISPCMLEEMGINLVMIGHSERRHVFGETNVEENRKVKAALRHGFGVLLCVGETLEEKEYGIAEEVLRTQLKVGFHGVDAEQVKHLWVAYEPVWSIGVGGTPASADYAEHIHKILRSTLQELFGEDGTHIPLLYGGSVNPDNASGLIVQDNIDGLFVGRAAWDADRFDALIRMAKMAYENQHTVG